MAILHWLTREKTAVTTIFVGWYHCSTYNTFNKLDTVIIILVNSGSIFILLIHLYFLSSSVIIQVKLLDTFVDQTYTYAINNFQWSYLLLTT